MPKRNVFKESWVEPLEVLPLPPVHSLPRLAGWVGARGSPYSLNPDWVAPEHREWWIYFLQGDDGGPIKIGRTAGDPRIRMSDIQVGYPFGALRVVGLIRSAMRMERELHARFSQDRMIGEWFTPTPDLVGFITQNARTP